MDSPIACDPIEIFVSSDDNYVLGVLVLIASIALKNGRVPFKANVGGLNWSDESRTKLSDLCASLDVPLNFIDVDPAFVSHLETKRDHVNSATYIRVFMGSLLPHLKKVIYLDCDMVCLGGLADLWSVSIPQGKVLAAVRCPYPMQLATALLDLDRTDYFNAGLLVVDLERWREHSIESRLLTAIKSRGQKYITEDESALNDVCRGSVDYLPAKYNVYTFNEADQPILSTPNDICFLHYILTPKPWNDQCSNDYIWHNIANYSNLTNGTGAQRNIPTRSALRRKQLIAIAQGWVSFSERRRLKYAMQVRNLDILSCHGIFRT